VVESKAYFVVLTTIWNLLCGGAIEKCTFGEHSAVLAKLILLANKSIYWSKGR
jgi:hypothetical protein